MSANTHIFAFMSNGSIRNMATTARQYEWQVPACRRAFISQVTVVIVDGGQRPTRFGGRSRLPLGCRFVLTDKNDNQLYDYTNGEPIRQNSDFGWLAGPGSVIRTAPGDDVHNVLWEIEGSGVPCRLVNQQKFKFIVRDNLSALTKMHIMVQGRFY